MTKVTRLSLDYVEFSSPAMERTQAFFADAFGWNFVEFGPDYREIQGAGIGGGLAAGPAAPPLVILKSDDLEATLERVRHAGAEITCEIFAFPGGRRFHFREPGGTGMAVWTTC